MSSLRSSRGYSSVTLDRLRYGSSVGPGVLAVGSDGVVGPTGALNLQSLNVMGTATIDTAVVNTLVIDDVEFRTVSAVDFQTQSLEVSGTGTINYLAVGGITGGTGLFGYLSVGGITGTTGAFADLTVDRLHINQYIDDVNHVSTISADYIAGVKIRAGDEGATGVQGQDEALYVKGDVEITGSIICDTYISLGGDDGLGTSISAVGNLECKNIRAVGTVRAKNDGVGPATFQLLSDIGGTGSVQWKYEENGAERTTMTVYPKPLGTTGVEVESTPLKTGVVGPAGVAGAIGDKYINNSMQVGGSLNVVGGATAGSFSTAGAVTCNTVSATQQITAAAIHTGKIYVDAISPFPSGSTGILEISTGIGLTNNDTIDPAKATTLSFGQIDASGNSNVTAYLVGANAAGFDGGVDNAKEQFCWYSYPKLAFGGGIYKVESTPLKPGTVGPAGVTGAIRDKYFYGSVQVAGGVYGSTGSFQNMTVNGLLTLRGGLVYDVQIL